MKLLVAIIKIKTKIYWYGKGEKAASNATTSFIIERGGGHQQLCQERETPIPPQDLLKVLHKFSLHLKSEQYVTEYVNPLWKFTCCII